MRAALILMVFISGIFLGCLTENLIPSGAILMAAFGLLCSAWAIKASPLNIDIRRRLGLSGVALLILGAGVLDGSLNVASEFDIQNDDPHNIIAAVESRRTLSSSEIYDLRIKEIDGRKERGELLLFTDSRHVLDPGEIISFRAKLKRDSSSNILQRRYVASVFGTESIDCIGETDGVLSFFQSLRNGVDETIGGTSLSHDTKALLRALLIADRSEISKDRTEILRNGGVIHALAVSGMHIAIIAAIIMLLTRPITALIGRKARLIIILTGIWIFIMMTGASFPTVRAGVMISVATLAMLLERKRDAFTAVCLATLAITAVRPSALFDVGLQLSFVSVVALALFAEPLNPIDHRKHPVTHWIYSLVLTTIIATGATWLLCGYHFGSVAIRFIPSNLVLLPILPIYTGAAILYLILAAYGADLEFLTRIIDAVPQLISRMLEWMTVPSVKIEVGLWSLAFWIASMAFFAIALPSHSASLYAQSGKQTTSVKNNCIIAGTVLAFTSLCLLALKL